MSANHMTSAGNYQNLFVAKLPISVSDAELMSVFASYSPSNATVMLDPVSGRSKGYAFVLFASESQGRAAATDLDKQSVTIARPDADSFTFELTIFASKHTGREVAVENECLYIRNIPNSWPMASVEAFIAQHGTPIYSAVRSDHLGSPVWVVFVEYDSVESARKTLKAVHGISISPRSPPILAKFAENDDVKKNRRNRKMGRGSRFNAPNSIEEEPSATCVSNGYSSVKSKPRIDASHQMHHPCHATHYDVTTKVSVSVDVTDVKPAGQASYSLPRPRSLNLSTSSNAMALPLPRSKQTPIASPTTTGPQTNHFGGSCSYPSGFAVKAPTPMSTTASTHYISSSSSSSSRTEEAVTPCRGGNRYRHNPYAQAFVPTSAVK
eukprot:GILI01003183.1.p1 GENE.GILI01003183.1~~GILI01003183.1.p1  ORF type:complete len:381 (-),score=79.66 GILI01003183.1:210-1352(-)